MSLKVMSKASLSKWVDHLCDGHRVVAPRRKQDEYVFEEIHLAAEVGLGYPTTILPPKKVLSPQREELFTFKGNGSSLEASLEDRPTVILGLHTCDMHAIALLNNVFNQNFVDQHYLKRRENTALVSIECLQPCTEHAFCKDMGTLILPEEFDLHLTDLGDNYAVDVGSKKGEALLKGFNGIREASAEDCRRVNQVLSEKWPRFTHRLESDVIELPSLLSIGYKSVLWDELGERCLSCGACTLVCPTCFCFNVIDEVEFSLDAGGRFRTWDSCQLDQFAVVAGGHNFRASRADRLRHRFLHKFRYLTESYEMVGCVGCGRCAQSCLVHITPIDTLNSLKHKVLSAKRS